MKFFVLLAAVAGIASAQSSTKGSAAAVSTKASGASMVTSAATLETGACLNLITAIPQCGFTLLTAAGASAYNCSLTDLGCQCSNSASIQSIIYSGVLSACGPTTALEVQSGAQSICDCYSYGGPTRVPPSRQITRTTGGINPSANKLCVSYGLAIPPCGTPVLQSIAHSLQGCGDFDFQCQCGRYQELQGIASTPVINACGTTTALLVQSAAAELCSCIDANNAPLQTGNFSRTTSTYQASAISNVPFVSLSGMAGFLSVLAGLVAWL